MQSNVCALGCAGVRQEQRAHVFAGQDALDGVGSACVGDHHRCPGEHAASGRFESAAHAPRAGAGGRRGDERKSLARDVAHHRHPLSLAVEQPLDVGQEESTNRR